ncbi:MAG: hypothetical protein IPL50_18565 [Chitinophagaceae bacterium]|nr:hypothetical protein [Chitinophagaceae bacterium]
MGSFNRRNFLRKTGTGILPVIIPFSSVLATGNHSNSYPDPATPIIKFFGDGEMFEPGDYLAELQKAHTATNIVRDRYGTGGVVEALEKNLQNLPVKKDPFICPAVQWPINWPLPY